MTEETIKSLSCISTRFQSSSLAGAFVSLFFRFLASTGIFIRNSTRTFKLLKSWKFYFFKVLWLFNYVISLKVFPSLFSTAKLDGGREIIVEISCTNIKGKSPGFTIWLSKWNLLWNQKNFARASASLCVNFAHLDSWLLMAGWIHCLRHSHTAPSTHSIVFTGIKTPKYANKMFSIRYFSGEIEHGLCTSFK